MPFVRRENGVVAGLRYRFTSGVAEEWLEEDDAEVVAYKTQRTVPQSITPRQMLLGLMAYGLITEQEALDAVQKGTMPVSIQKIFDRLPTAEERVDAVITWAKPPDPIARDHPIISTLAAANNLSEDEVNAFIVACSKL